jgi:cytochrome c oxidase subunit 2
MKKFYAIILSSLLFVSCQTENAEEVELNDELEIEVEEEKVEDNSNEEDATEIEDTSETKVETENDEDETELKVKSEVETETEEVEEKVEVKTQSTVREFTMTAQNWSFSPSTITVNQGDTVIIHISAEGNHGFKLAAFGINETISDGGSTTIKFVADQKGTFTFSCSVPCGSGHANMSGTLIVS